MGAAFDYSLDNYRFDYLLFLDDDSFLNVFILDEVALTFPTRNMWWGYIIYPSGVIYDKNHRVRKQQRLKEKKKKNKYKKEKKRERKM